MFQLSIQVIFRDVDAMGHVNNAVYFTYMETARTRFFMKELGLERPADLPVIVAEAACTYHSPARFNETLTVTIEVPRIGTKSFDLHYEIAAEDGRAVALGRTVMVAYDYANGTTIAIPAELRSILDRHRPAAASSDQSSI